MRKRLSAIEKSVNGGKGVVGDVLRPLNDPMFQNRSCLRSQMKTKMRSGRRRLRIRPCHELWTMMNG